MVERRFGVIASLAALSSAASSAMKTRGPRLDAAGDKANAAPTFEKAIAIWPGNPVHRNALVAVIAEDLLIGLEISRDRVER